MRRRLGLVLLFALACAACDETPGFGTAPRIRVVPTSHAFSSVAVGSQDSLRVTVTNIGGGTLNVSGVDLVSGSSPDFSLSGVPALPRALGANQSFAFDVIYRPQDVGADSGRVAITSDDRFSQVVHVDLRTLEIGPDITVEPDVLDFGTVPRNQTQSLTATIRNDGFADLILENIVVSPGSDFEIVEPASLPLTLSPGASTSLRVAYTPRGCSADQDVVQIFSNDPDEVPYGVTVMGRPPGPAIAAEPPAVNFGAVNLGGSATETVVLRNVGSTDLSISGIFAGIGTSASFTIAAPSTPLTLAANQTTNVMVTYNASAAGIARGALVAASDDCDHPQLQVPLEAIGTDGPAALIQLSPDTLNFGNVASGTTRDLTFDVVSIGSQPLDVSGIAREAGTSAEFSVVSGGGAFQLGACTSPPCPRRTVTVRYAPTATGADSGNLVVSSNAANDPMAKLALTANGTQGGTCELQVTPFNLNFQQVLLNSHKDLPLTLTNRGTGNCAYDRTDLDPLAAFQGFSVVSQPGIGAIIGPGQSRQVVIRLAPLSLGPRFSFAFVHWNDANGPQPWSAGQNSPQVITLIGESTEADIAVIPPDLDFGLITVGCASLVQTVTVFNTGAAPLTITGIELQNAGASRYQIIQAPSAGTVVPGGGSVDISVRYVPNAVGTDTDTLIIRSDDMDEPETRVPLTGQGTTVTDVVDKFVQSTDPKVDILFVIDNSGSMGDEQQNLRTNFANFINFAQTLNVDYHIGIITTDDAKLRGNPKIITRSTPNPTSVFSANANVGTSGSGTEPGLQRAYEALSPPLRDNENGGFLRDDASLEIIVVSDEEDQSSQNLDFYITFFYSIKGAQNTSLFRFNAIAGDVPGGCSSSSGQAEAAQRYLEVANRTGGVFGSICSSNFSTTLQAIGNVAFALRVQFFLTRQPDLTQPMSVRAYASEAACNADPTATMGGTVVPVDPNNGYTYESQSNSVIFGPQAVPQRGECAQVKYKAACNPP